MFEQNICHYIPFRQDDDKIHIIHFVLETKPQDCQNFKCISMNRLHLVTGGKGVLHTASGSYPLETGDLFFLLPAVPHAIESGPDFQYAYISYLGTRGNAIMDKLKISGTNFVFPGFPHLCEMWLQGLQVNEQVSDLRSESILLYTFSVLGDGIFSNVNTEKHDSSIVLQIRKYIDNHISDEKLSLKTISGELLYNPKYCSTAFKSVMNVGISEYITTLRIQQACTLMNQGFTSVKDIAALCGFKDPLYFSKVFRKKTGESPKEYQSHFLPESKKS